MDILIQLPPYKTDAENQQPVYDYTIPLGERTYRVKITYMTRQARWYLNLYAIDDTPLIKGIFLAVNLRLLQYLQIEGLPEGDLMLMDLSDAGTECGWADLGNRCELAYLEPEDIPSPTALPDITITGAP